MKKVISQSIFHSYEAPPRTWQSYATSGAVHAVIILLAFLITFPTVTRLAQPEHFTLIAPIPAYKPKVIPRPHIVPKPVLDKQLVVKEIPKPKVIPPPVVKPPEPPKVMAKAPEIKPVAPVAMQNIPEQKVAPPAPPKPEVKTGVFQSAELAKGPKVPHELKVGGFGDPNGVHPDADAHPARLVAAKLGGFDMPNGDGHTGGGGHAANGGVHAAGFGSAGDPNGVPGGTGTHGTVRTGGFGDGTVADAHGPTRAAAAEPATTPIEILFKPKPTYTPEARQLGVQGQVVLQVVFQANGSVRTIRVVRGLGHGLDEAAQQAATQIRFKPATRGGVPVDLTGNITLTFELT